MRFPVAIIGALSAQRRRLAAAFKKSAQVNIVVVGDSACGKTSLLLRFCRFEFKDRYMPTIFETYVTDVTMRRRKINLVLSDTAGLEEYDHLLAFSFEDADVFLLCFSFDNYSSLENIVEKWLPLIRHHCPSVPIVLAGLKEDMKSKRGKWKHYGQKKKKFVTSALGSHLAFVIRANGYCECSALSCKGVCEVFEKCVTVALKYSSKQKKNKCCACF